MELSTLHIALSPLMANILRSVGVVWGRSTIIIKPQIKLFF